MGEGAGAFEADSEGSLGDIGQIIANQTPSLIELYFPLILMNRYFEGGLKSREKWNSEIAAWAATSALRSTSR